jgi:GntR family transcriptional repressor for pyruvate dehydrogenase complex
MTNLFKPVPTTHRLSVQVAEQLASAIRKGKLKQGDKLPTEAQLVSQFEVSRTVVREALSRLKSLGLIDSQQGSGIYVSAPSPFQPLNFDVKHAASREAVIQIVEVRRALEAECASLAAIKRTPEDIQFIHQSLDQLDQAVARGEDGVEEDVQFHRAIANAAGNPFLISTLDYLAQFLREGTRVTRANEARRQDFASAVRHEHHAIAQAIEAGDSKLAHRAATLHMKNAAKRIQHADGDFWSQEGGNLALPLVKKVKG